MTSMTRNFPSPKSGTFSDMEDDDNNRGPERDETDNAFQQLVAGLVVDGDNRARSADRKARRTLAEMAPGYKRQPVLLLTRPFDFRSANDACGLCGFWACRCPSAAPAPAKNSGQLQCDTCSGWFGFTGWTCPACKQLQGAALPMRPTPHERDGRTELPSEPARPHSERRQP
ncbi:hypothetical protein [Streptomyces sp. NPDC048565]|uniref:hypothetical protein n=1 Tax=Streptomyces sp. NPDC048565 TaxID=3155266 RepID=UPI00341D7C1C